MKTPPAHITIPSTIPPKKFVKAILSSGLKAELVARKVEPSRRCLSSYKAVIIVQDVYQAVAVNPVGG